MLSLLSAVYFRRDIEDTIPVVTGVFMLLLYIAGIAGVISHVRLFLALYVISGCIIFIFMTKRRTGSLKKIYYDAIYRLKAPGFWIFIILLVLSAVVCRHMRVTNFDDLHYWAIFPKDMYAINGVPSGWMSSTLYRDYFPVIQYLYFVVFKLIGHFSEPAMFFVNYALLLLCMLPFFKKRDGQDMMSYTASLLTGIFLPGICSYQMYYCLGVDIIMTFMFGNALIFAFDKRRDAFYYVRFTVITTVLTMSKTTGLIFSAIALAVFAIENFRPKAKNICFIVFAGLSNIVFYFSWKIFCRIKGNTTYLSNILKSNMDGGTGIKFPDYAAVTVKSFIKELFVMHLNGGVIGMSAAMMFACSLIIGILCIKNSEERVRHLLELTAVICGMVGYLLVMIYIYLFVFEDWEALSLSSYERYIATFFGGILCTALFFFINMGLKKNQLKLIVVTMLIATINFSFAQDAWIPRRFESKYGEMTRLIDELETEEGSVFSEDMHYGDGVLFVDGKDDMSRSKAIAYCGVPYVSRVMSLIDRQSYSADEILDTARDMDVKYVIFLKRSEDEKVMIDDEDKLFGDGTKMETDVLYGYDPENNVLRVITPH